MENRFAKKYHGLWLMVLAVGLVYGYWEKPISH